MAARALAAVLWALVAPAQGIVPDDTIPEYLAKYGISVQEHHIITDDGYILDAFRLPRKGAPVVTFQHGILSSAWCWLDNEPDIAPAIQVYNMGYDVWLTNSRGNVYSQKHVTLQPTLNKKFWNFSFPELGRYDLPANIRYILNETARTTLTFVGHSQGTSLFFSAMTDPATKGFLESKVNLFVAMAPVAYLAHQQADLLRVLTDLHLGGLLATTFPYGFLEWSSMKVVADFLCSITKGIVCQIGVDIVCGVSPEDTAGAITNISAHFPAGTSVKAMNHYAQLISSGKFQDYDYGPTENRQTYGSETPRVFNLSQARVPTALFVGENDDLGDVTDAGRLAGELPGSTLVFNKTYPGYSHITWFAGTWASFQAWFPAFQGLLATYNPLQGQEAKLVV